MLRRLTLGFALVTAAAVAVSACSSNDSNSTISIGPNFPSQTLYATNSTQNAINIYPPTTKGGAPAYQIGGSATTLSGPQYLTFDNLSNLFVTNYNVSASALFDRRDQGACDRQRLAVQLGNAQFQRSAARHRVSYMQPAVVASASPAPALVIAAVNAGAASGFTSQLRVLHGTARRSSKRSPVLIPDSTYRAA